MSTSAEPDKEIGKSFLLMQEGLLEKYELRWDLNIIPGTEKPTSLKILDVIFMSGPLADLKHTLKVYQPEANKTSSLTAQLKLLDLDDYNEETSRLKLTDERTMTVTLDKAQMDFYSNGKITDSHDLTITKNRIGTTSVRWDLKPDTAFTESQLTGDMLRYRMFLQFDSLVEGNFLRSCLNAPNMFLSEQFSDIQVVCSDESKWEISFPSHRFVLSYNSPVLDRMIQSDMKEAKEGRIVIEDMSPASVKELLRFMYIGKFVVTDDCTFELYKAADKYDIKLLKRQCQEYLLQRLSIQNAMDVYMLGETYGCSSLKEKSFEFIKKHKNNLLPSSSILKMKVVLINSTRNILSFCLSSFKSCCNFELESFKIYLRLYLFALLEK